MTIAANRPGQLVPPGTAQDSLHEMAAVVRTVFGVGLQASRRAAAAAAVRAESSHAQVEAPSGPTVVAAPPAGLAPIPVPGVTAGVPLPEPAMSYGEVPALAPFPVPALDEVSVERRHAVLQELSFLDD